MSTKRKKFGDGWELRFDDSAKGENEQLDELVMNDAKHVHLESMGGSWCLIVHAKDGTTINLTLYGTKKTAKGFVFELTLPKQPPCGECGMRDAKPGNLYCARCAKKLAR